MNKGKKRLDFKLMIVLVGTILLSLFWLTSSAASGPVSLVISPSVPRENEPVVVTFKLNNPSSEASVTDYQLYVNGELLTEGTTTIAPASSESLRYSYDNTLNLGDQLNFVVKTQSEHGNYEKVVSMPPYPPQIWSSFVSFASFSTSVMSSISTMTYYQTTFNENLGLNVGIIIFLILIGLLIFTQLTQPVAEQHSIGVLGKLRGKFSIVTWLLFVVTMGFVYTALTMIMAVT